MPADLDNRAYNSDVSKGVFLGSPEAFSGRLNIRSVAMPFPWFQGFRASGRGTSDEGFTEASR